MVYVRPAGREACRCGTPYNTILERLDALASDIASAADMARDAYDVANAQAGNAAQYASDARDAADDALIHAQAAQQSADDALAEATAAAGSASDAADSAADAAQALSDINDTIASVLASDIGDKLDKLTTAGFYLYSHNGSTQGEVQPVVAPTAATIPIRDSNGRMQAADPASGATDKTLVTANWVSQTGDSAPNNLVHRSGTETITGTKNMSKINAVLGPNQRVTGTSKIELMRFSFPASSTVAIRMLYMDRGQTSLLSISMTTDASKPTSISATDLFNNTIPYIVAYRINDDVIIGTGNPSSRNYIYSNMVLLSYVNAAIVLPIDLQNCGRSITAEIPEDAVVA